MQYSQLDQEDRPVTWVLLHTFNEVIEATAEEYGKVFITLPYLVLRPNQNYWTVLVDDSVPG